MATPVKKGSQQRGVRPRSSAGVRAPKAGARKEQSAARRDAIVAAALDEFSARGFAATRLEDIAKRAGVAKGTIYLHFADKEKLFEEIVRTMVVPFVANMEAPPVDLPVRVILNAFIETFIREVYMTRRREVLRLVFSEVPRFPALADFYYKNVVERAIGALRGVMSRALAKGEIADDTLVRFPQLLAGPGMIAIVWNALFERHAPLDIKALMHAQLDLVLGKEKS
jgi:AcrR family transcriptional regulator